MLNKFNNLSLNVKFLISCLWMLIPLLIVLSFLVQENIKTVDIIREENVGNHIVHHLYPNVLGVKESELYNSKTIAARLESNYKQDSNNNTQSKHDMAGMDMTDMDMTGLDLESSQHEELVGKAISEVEKETKALENAHDQQGTNPIKSSKFPELSAKIYALVDEIERAKSNSGLTADREPETFYLTYISSTAIPKYLKQIADFNTFLSINRNLSARAEISSANLILLEKSFEEFLKTSDHLIRSIENPKRRIIIEELSKNYITEKQILIHEISELIVKGDKYTGKINYQPTLEQSVHYTSAVAELLDDNLKRMMFRTWVRLGYELLVTIFAVAIGLVLVRLLLSSVAQPLTKSTHVMEELSEGIVPDTLPEFNQADFSRKDEIGKLTKALKSFHEVLLERKSLLDARELEKAIANRAKRVEMLNREFENESRHSLAILAESSKQLNMTAKSMVGSANNTNENAASVATATQQVGDFIEVVSTSSHELVRSLDQIGTQVETSQDTIRAAVSEAKESITQINNLNNAADKIGDIVGLINSIASQTNLLALNATIEAARAGDAGRGFAVVANEVKSLAAQTANATEEISAQIGAMQSATNDTVRTIERIAATINRIDSLAGTIRESLQRERAMTENMTNLVKQAENGADQVTSNLSQFTKAADTTSSAAEQVLGASEAMRDQASLLNARIDTYLQAVASA